MQGRNLPLKLQLRLANYYTSLIQDKISKGRVLEDQVLDELPLDLRVDVITYLYKDLVESTSFLRNLPKAVMCKIVGKMGLVPRDECVIYKAGDSGHECFIVASGSVILTSIFGDQMAKLCKGSLFGELGVLMPGSRRVCTATLSPGASVRSMSRAVLEPFMCDYPEVAHELYRQYLAHANRQLTFLQKCRARMQPFSVLHITIVEATGLQSFDVLGKSDPYCIMQFQDMKHKTEVCKRSLSPVWREDFDFPIMDGRTSDSEMLKIRLYDWDWATADDFMGEVEIPFSFLSQCPGEFQSQWFDFNDDKRGTLAKNNETCSGQILVRWKLKMMQENQDLGAYGAPRLRRQSTISRPNVRSRVMHGLEREAFEAAQNLPPLPGFDPCPGDDDQNSALLPRPDSTSGYHSKGWGPVSSSPTSQLASVQDVLKKVRALPSSLVLRRGLTGDEPRCRSKGCLAARTRGTRWGRRRRSFRPSWPRKRSCETLTSHG